MTDVVMPELDMFKSLCRESGPSQKELAKILASIPGLSTETKSFQHYLDEILPGVEMITRINHSKLENLAYSVRKFFIGKDEDLGRLAIPDYSARKNYLRSLKTRYAITIENLENILKNDETESVKKEKIYELQMFVCGFKHHVDEIRKISNEVWRSEIASAEYPEEALKCLERNQQNDYAK